MFRKFILPANPHRRSTVFAAAAVLMTVSMISCATSDVIVSVNSVVDEVTISVDPPLGAATEVALSVGDSAKLSATPSNALGIPIKAVPVTWSSQDPTVVTVSGAGLLRAVSPGTTTVTATADEVSGTLAVTVNDVQPGG